QTKLEAKAAKEECQKLAFEKSEEADKLQEELESLLNHTLHIDDSIDWESLKDRSDYPTKKPNEPLVRRLNKLPKKPSKQDFTPEKTFFDKLIKSLYLKKLKIAKTKYEQAIKDWKRDTEATENLN